MGVGYLKPVKNLMLWFAKGLATGIAVAGRGTLFVMVLLQLWYLIHIFDRNGGDAIVFHGYRQRT